MEGQLLPQERARRGRHLETADAVAGEVVRMNLVTVPVANVPNKAEIPLPSSLKVVAKI